jgi:hypothetical protein
MEKMRRGNIKIIRNLKKKEEKIKHGGGDLMKRVRGLYEKSLIVIKL